MAQRGIREYDGKRLMAKFVPDYWKGFNYPGKIVFVDPKTDMKKLAEQNKWLQKDKLVVKPDQLFGKRGKHKLLLLNANYPEAQKWIKERMNKKFTVGKTTGILTDFMIEPFVPHDGNEEYYVAIKTEREGDTVYFSTKGGIFVEENWDKVSSASIPIGGSLDPKTLESLVSKAPPKRREEIKSFIGALYKFFADLNFTYLEINPFTFSGKELMPLDLVARVDDTAEFESGSKWGKLAFPAPFGRVLSEEEAYVKSLDEKTGASLKLTILNRDGRIWTMVAGGGASVIFADTVADLGFAGELANYGEYSGDPDEEFTYLYAKTILDLMTMKKDPRGKVLIIGGGIANFTDVAATFKGINRALREHAKKLRENKVKIYVRRGGPNYQEGLKQIKDVAEECGLNMEVYGPEMHMTRVVSMALKGGKK
ncbi:MAG: ATP citrate lyase citrate-binding domain-containing protein [archaeon]